MARELIAIYRNYLPFVVPGLSTRSSTSPSPTSSRSSSQDSVIGTENPAIERSGSMSEELRRNPMHKPTETENIKKMKDAKKYRAIYCMTCPIGYRCADRIWLMKVLLESHGETTRLRIKTLPVLLMNYQWSRESKSGTRFGYAQCVCALSEGPKLRYMLEDENNKGFLQKTCWYSHAQSGRFR